VFYNRPAVRTLSHRSLQVSRQPEIDLHIGTSIDAFPRMQFLIDSWNETEPYTTLRRMAWGLSEISLSTGLSVAFLRAEVRAGRLPVRRFGRRVLVRDEDLKAYLSRGSDRKSKSAL
jgi:excisionase family DNA binding protein